MSHSEKGFKKTRKPYTITKPRESWTDEEHSRFIEALSLYERDWKRIEEHVSTKSVIQIRSHAQKYFIKMQKQGNEAFIPPPRPKRRSKKPYPKSRDKKKRVLANGHGLIAEAIEADPMDVRRMGMSMQRPQHAMFTNDPAASGAYGFGDARLTMPDQTRSLHPQTITPTLQWSLWERQQLAELQQEQMSQAQYYMQQAIAAQSTEKNNSSNQKIPDFQKIYSFLGSLFDPSTTGHVQQLRSMDAMDRQVVQLLMQNLASNLAKSNDGSQSVPSLQVPTAQPAIDHKFPGPISIESNPGKKIESGTNPAAYEEGCSRD